MYYPPASQRQNIPSLVPRTVIGTLPTIPKAQTLWCSRWCERAIPIEYTPDELDAPQTAKEYFDQWEARHERLIWMSALIKKVVERMRQQASEKPSDAPQDPEKT
jgi:hypothetical protein